MAPLDTTFGTTQAASADRDFAFGGVRFEIVPDPSQGWSMPPASREYVLPASSASCAAVTCAVRVDVGLPELAAGKQSEHATSVWESIADGVRVRAAALEFEAREIGPRRFACSARLRDPKATAELLVLLASAVLELSGGLCMHATAVELDGRALLLLGPSGAGKTTAAQLLRDFPCFTFDRVAVVPNAETEDYVAWAVPGGSPPRLPRSRARLLPLAGFVRVAKGYEKPGVRPLGPGEAALYLREAVEIGVGAGFLEPRRLETVSRLALAAPGGRAEVVLGQGWAPELRSLLAAWAGAVGPS